jgi:hypothetical protein
MHELPSYADMNVTSTPVIEGGKLTFEGIWPKALGDALYTARFEVDPKTLQGTVRGRATSQAATQPSQGALSKQDAKLIVKKLRDVIGHGLVAAPEDVRVAVAIAFTRR